MGDSMTSLLVPIGFLLMNIVILLIWWIVRRERERISQLEEKINTVGRIVMDIQYQQKRQTERMGQFHGDHVMAEEVANSSSQNIPDTMTENTEEELEDIEEIRPRIEEIEPNLMKSKDVSQNSVKEKYDEDNEDKDDEHDDEHDDDSDYGSELDSLTDEENVHIHNQNDAHEKISVSDVESLAEDEVHDDKESTPEVKTIRLHEVSQESNESTPFQGMFELGEQEQEKSQIEIQESNEQHESHQEQDETQHHELDEEQYKQLSKMTVKELRKLATEKGIRHVEKLKKKTLVIQLSVIPSPQDKTNDNHQEHQEHQESQPSEEDKLDTLD